MKNKLLLLSFVCTTLLAHAQLPTTIWSENFDTENISAWTLIDADGDGFKWITAQMLGPNFQPIGTPFLTSVSYTQYNNIGDVFPDNWAITPAIDLSSVSTGNVIQLQWAIVDSAYSWNPHPNNEHYAVYIAESNDTVSFIEAGIKFAEYNTPQIYTIRNIDISEYVGKSIYIAFRHFNVSDSIAVPFSSSVEIDDMKIVTWPNTLSISPTTRTVSDQPGTTTFNVTSNAAWTGSSDANWCAVTPSGTGNSVLIANYQQNLTYDIRTAEITVVGQSTSPVVVQVIQLPSFVGVENNTENSIKVFPNPTNGIFVINSPSGDLLELKATIMNANGQIVLIKECKGASSYSFDFSKATSGYYFIKMEINNKIQVMKIVVK